IAARRDRQHRRRGYRPDAQRCRRGLGARGSGPVDLVSPPLGHAARPRRTEGLTMADMTPEALAAQCPPGAALPGLYRGTKTIGIALSDRSLRFAHPRPVLRRTRFGRDAEALSQLFEREKVAALVIGLPVNMDGTEGPRAQASRAFARNFDRIRPMPIVLWDERLSTVAAERALIGMDVSRSKRAERIDSAAAAFILQGVLDWLRRVRASPSAS